MTYRSRNHTRAAGLAAVLALAGAAIFAPAAGAAPRPATIPATVIYDSTTTPLPSNQVSVGAEATQFAQLGAEVNTVPNGRALTTAVVTLSSQICQSLAAPTCTTTPGATFTTPITLNIYAVGPDGTAPGATLASVTQSFAIPFRPSADPVNCPSSQRWWDGTACKSGLATNVTFDLASLNLVLPTQIIYGISYNTQHQGPNPTGDPNDPTNSLNVALAADPTGVTVGSSVTPGTAWINMQPGSALRCDQVGTQGVGSFASVDATCWGPPNYVPAVQFNTSATPPPPPPSGYWETASDGGVFTFGSAGFYGSMGGSHLNQPVVGMATTPDGKGYWLVARDGGIFSFGDAGFYGSTGAITLNKPIVGMDATSDGHGYWLVAADGGVFAFGDAGFHGSLAGQTTLGAIVSMAATPDGGGYTLASSGGIPYSLGNAPVYTNTGGHELFASAVSIATTPSGNGLWLTGSDGSITSYGDAHLYGGMTGTPLHAPIVGMAPDTAGTGYWMVGADGGIFAFGSALFQGSMGGTTLNAPVVGMAAYPTPA